MAPKKGSDTSGNAKRKNIKTIEMKKEIIAKFESGHRVSDLAAEYNMAKSTVSSILKSKEAIKAANVAKGVKSLCTKQRSQTIEEVEKLLFIWINQKQLYGDCVSETLICEKARNLHADLLQSVPTASGEEPEVFRASHGWFEKFKRRTGIHSVVKHREVLSASSMPKIRQVKDRTSSTKEEDSSQELLTEENPLELPFTPESSHGVGNVTDSLNGAAAVSPKRSRLSSSRYEIPQRMQLTSEPESDDMLRAMRSNIENSYASDRFDHLAKNWAEKLRNLNPTQRIYVEKLVNDVFYEGELCSLSRNSRVLVGESPPTTQQFTSSFTPVSYATPYQLPNSSEQQLQDQINDDSFIIVKDEILSEDD